MQTSQSALVPPAIPTVSFFRLPMIAWYPRARVVLLGLPYRREN